MSSFGSQHRFTAPITLLLLWTEWVELQECLICLLVILLNICKMRAESKQNKKYLINSVMKKKKRLKNNYFLLWAFVVRKFTWLWPEKETLSWLWGKSGCLRPSLGEAECTWQLWHGGLTESMQSRLTAYAMQILLTV